MENGRIKDQLSKLPNKPGVYQFFNHEGEIIYVGKAKDLRKRVSNYFTKSKEKDYKTNKLVSKIADIKITLVNNEYEALLLENNLIKRHAPRYNVMLRDDKTYPYLCVVNERFPRIISTRSYNQEQGIYFGPYTSVRAMNTVLELIRKLYTIRTCKYDLSEENIKKGKFKVCLEYHLGNCLGPCEGLQTEKHYNEEIEQAKNILKGNLQTVKDYFTQKMQNAAENLNFEKAQEWKEKRDILINFQSKSLVINQKFKDLDIFSIEIEKYSGWINYLKISNGYLIHSKTIEVKKSLDEQDSEILNLGIMRLREEFQSRAKEIITNIPVNFPDQQIKITVPQKGDKKKLVDLSLKNAHQYKKEKNEKSKTKQENSVLKELQNNLHLKEMPLHIECFDNSNLQGSHPVAAMVCFKNGKPAKSLYRKFNIKTVEGIDDYSSMYEVVYRRYNRLINENQALPQLIIIDGGKGQLNAASKALKDLNLYSKISQIGIAKKLEEIYTPEDETPLYLNKKSGALKLIQQIRDEAHRFAITFHRSKRKTEFKSKLSELDGIGEKTENYLLKHYKSLEQIKKATFDELKDLIGKQKANTIKNNLK